MPSLILVRHGKAEQFAASDHERPLAERGRGDAAAVGRALAAAGVVAPVGYVSTARRTRQTWEELAAAAGWQRAPHFDAGLYGAGEDGVLELLRATEPATDTVVVVGNNPTMAGLAQMLDDGEGAATAGPTAGFPTSAYAVFTVPAWAELSEMGARLDLYGVGRG